MFGSPEDAVKVSHERRRAQGLVRRSAARYGQAAIGFHRSPAALFQGINAMSIKTKLDHCVIHVSDWERSNAFYRDVLGAELVQRPVGFAYRFGDKQLNVHGPGVSPAEVARLPVQPGNSDLCFEWVGPIADAVAHLAHCGVAVERGPLERFGARGRGTSVYFRDPDGSLMEFMSYKGDR